VHLLVDKNARKRQQRESWAAGTWEADSQGARKAQASCEVRPAPNYSHRECTGLSWLYCSQRASEMQGLVLVPQHSIQRGGVLRLSSAAAWVSLQPADVLPAGRVVAQVQLRHPIPSSPRVSAAAEDCTERLAAARAESVPARQNAAVAASGSRATRATCADPETLLALGTRHGDVLLLRFVRETPSGSNGALLASRMDVMHFECTIPRCRHRTARTWAVFHAPCTWSVSARLHFRICCAIADAQWLRCNMDDCTVLPCAITKPWRHPVPAYCTTKKRQPARAGEHSSMHHSSPQMYTARGAHLSVMVAQGATP
jgi:hypothetical protein